MSVDASTPVERPISAFASASASAFCATMLPAVKSRPLYLVLAICPAGKLPEQRMDTVRALTGEAIGGPLSGTARYAQFNRFVTYSQPVYDFTVGHLPFYTHPRKFHRGHKIQTALS